MGRGGWRERAVGISGGVGSRSVLSGRDGKRVSKSGTCEKHGSHG